MHLLSSLWMELVTLAGYSKMKLRIDQIKEIRKNSVIPGSLNSYAIDGHFAGSYSGLELSTDIDKNARIEFEFNKIVNIKKILIITHSSSVFFKSIEALVGDRSQISTGDYSSLIH